MIIGAVILAAGKSERMGQNKQLLKLNGKTLIEGILDALSEADINEQVVVLGDDMAQTIEAIRTRIGKVKIAINVAPQRGMSSSIQTGVFILDKLDAFFVLLGDQPIFDPSVLKTMIKTMEINPEAQIVAPVYRGKKGHPLLFRKSMLNQIMGLKGNQTMRDLIHQADKLLTVEAPEWTTWDIDTPEDYARIVSQGKNA